MWRSVPLSSERPHISRSKLRSQGQCQQAHMAWTLHPLVMLSLPYWKHVAKVDAQPLCARPKDCCCCFYCCWGKPGAFSEYYCTINSNWSHQMGTTLSDACIQRRCPQDESGTYAGEIGNRMLLEKLVGIISSVHCNIRVKEAIATCWS